MPKSFPWLSKPLVIGVGILAAVGIPMALLAYTGLYSGGVAYSAPLQPIGYIAQDEVSNFNLTSGAETLYRPEYNQRLWSGNLHAYPVDAGGNINLGAERWAGGAALKMDTQFAATAWDTGRYIATMNASGSAVAFRAANVTGANLIPSTLTVTSTSYTANQIVNFLRGDRSNEGSGLLRPRASTLGDIIHSRPYFVDDQNDPTIFVGANDGMLHAIDGNAGTERWAYVPSVLLGKLKTLAYNPDDTTSGNVYAHDYFVDGQINIGSITNAAGTGTLRALFGGLGAGGAGLYALDISTLTAATESAVASKVLWEISSAGVKSGGSITGASSYTHLGYTYGVPQVVTIKDTTHAGNVRDVLIVGNGYLANANGVAYLYVIDALTGALVKEISATLSGNTGANGIFNPKAIDSNNDGYVDRVYAGDLNGNLWKFDLSNTTPSSWPNQTAPLFTDTVSGSTQPITSTIGVAVHPKGGFLVSFGTGSTLTGAMGTYDQTTHAWTTASTGEMLNNQTHWIYGIWDGAPGALPTNSDLLLQTLQERSYTFNSVVTRVRRASANVPNWSTNKGWKVALPVTGERVVGEGSFTENGRFYFNSYNPTVTPTLIAGTSTSIYGENWLMELNYLTGGSATTPFLDMDTNQLLNDADRIVYTAADTKPSGKNTGDPIVSPNEDGIIVGKMISLGVQSQPILVQLSRLNTTLMNQNPDVIYPSTTSLTRGVAGGHFDVDYFYNDGQNGGCSPVNGGAGASAVGKVKFTYNNSQNIQNLKISANGTQIYSGSPGNLSTNGLATAIKNAGSSSSSYAITKNSSTITITATTAGSAFNGAITVTGLAGSNFTITNMAGGADATASSPTASTKCGYDYHQHEYDDAYDKTGVNFLNASDNNYNLDQAIPNASTPFKVLLMNQYLNPALQIHIGNPSYVWNSPAGYVAVKNFQTSAKVTLSAEQTYSRDGSAPGSRAIGSLVLNMPVEAFTVSNWWGGSPADNRVGLQPTSPACVFYGAIDSQGNSAASINADMYSPVIPLPENAQGNGTKGTSTGVRHNGAITIQIVRADTPDTAIELNYAGHPEYGSRLTSADFYNYLIAEYSIYWHHPSRVCYGDSTTRWYDGNNYGSPYVTASSGAWNTAALMVGTGWSKTFPQDITNSNGNCSGNNNCPPTPAQGSTDPKLGSFGAGNSSGDTTSTVINGNITITTITHADGTITVITTTVNTDGTATVQTQQKDASGNVTSTTTSTVANASGNVKTGGDERGYIAKTGRISWREVSRP